MFELIYIIISNCIFVAIIICVFLPKPAFILRITEGNVLVKKGRLPKGFLNECEMLAQENNITNATIRGVRKKGSISLKFSGRISEGTQQRFRNAWIEYS